MENMIQVPDRTGRAAYRTVTKTSNILEVEDHNHVLAEPGGSYIYHMTPEEGTGYALAKEIVDENRYQSHWYGWLCSKHWDPQWSYKVGRSHGGTGCTACYLWPSLS